VTTDQVFLKPKNLKESYSLGTYTTVFQAEVYAMQKVRIETIHKFSDSKAALMALSLV
jgi:hypothetical protein